MVSLSEVKDYQFFNVCLSLLMIANSKGGINIYHGPICAKHSVDVKHLI